jgi:hypothetical protein
VGLSRFNHFAKMLLRVRKTPEAGNSASVSYKMKLFEDKIFMAGTTNK